MIESIVTLSLEHQKIWKKLQEIEFLFTSLYHNNDKLFNLPTNSEWTGFCLPKKPSYVTNSKVFKSPKLAEAGAQLAPKKVANQSWAGYRNLPMRLKQTKGENVSANR